MWWIVNSKGKKILHDKISLRSHFYQKIHSILALCRAWLFALMRLLKAITQIEICVSSKVNKINLVRTDLYLFVWHRAESVFWYPTNTKVLSKGYNFCALRVKNHNYYHNYSYFNYYCNNYNYFNYHYNKFSTKKK